MAMLVEVATTVTSPPTRLPNASGRRSLERGTRSRWLTEFATGMRVATTPGVGEH